MRRTAKRTGSGKAWRLLIAALLAGCGHGEVMRVPTFGSVDPPYPGTPTRLTLSAGTDLWPTWLPDGTGILYSAERLDRPDRDWCLAVLPPSGGRVIRTICENTTVGEDSVETYQSAAALADGRVLYVRTSGRRGELGATAQQARSRALMLGSLRGPLGARQLFSVPFTITGVRTYTGLSQFGWAGPATLVYRGDFLGLVCLIQVPNCPRAFVQSGLGIIRQTLDDPSTREVLPGTSDASSVWVGDDGDALYYTLGGDARVYRMVLSTLTSSVVYDFGAAGIARDVQVRGTRLVAVVGGPTVSYGFNASVATNIQIDTLGGDIHVVDLLTGAEASLAVPLVWFRHPALSPAGDRVVAESAAAGSWDLWLFEVP